MVKATVMVGIGVSEARRDFSRLLDRVQGGDRIVITRRGKPVAVLVRAEAVERSDIEDVIRMFREIRARTKQRVSIRMLREEGRRQ